MAAVRREEGVHRAQRVVAELLQQVVEAAEGVVPTRYPYPAHEPYASAQGAAAGPSSSPHPHPHQPQRRSCPSAPPV